MTSPMDDWKEIGALRARVAQLEAEIATSRRETMDQVEMRHDEQTDNEARIAQLEAALRQLINVHPEPNKCANCGHSIEQHTKGPAQANYCRHCPCSGFIPFAMNRKSEHGT